MFYKLRNYASDDTPTTYDLFREDNQLLNNCPEKEAAEFVLKEIRDDDVIESHSMINTKDVVTGKISYPITVHTITGRALRNSAEWCLQKEEVVDVRNNR